MSSRLRKQRQHGAAASSMLQHGAAAPAAPAWRPAGGHSAHCSGCGAGKSSRTNNLKVLGSMNSSTSRRSGAQAALRQGGDGRVFKQQRGVHVPSSAAEAHPRRTTLPVNRSMICGNMTGTIDTDCTHMAATSCGGAMPRTAAGSNTGSHSSSERRTTAVESCVDPVVVEVKQLAEQHLHQQQIKQDQQQERPSAQRAAASPLDDAGVEQYARIIASAHALAERGAAAYAQMAAYHAHRLVQPLQAGSRPRAANAVVNSAPAAVPLQRCVGDRLATPGNRNGYCYALPGSPAPFASCPARVPAASSPTHMLASPPAQDAWETPAGRAVGVTDTQRDDHGCPCCGAGTCHCAASPLSDVAPRVLLFTGCAAATAAAGPSSTVAAGNVLPGGGSRSGEATAPAANAAAPHSPGSMSLPLAPRSTNTPMQASAGKMRATGKQGGAMSGCSAVDEEECVTKGTPAVANDTPARVSSWWRPRGLRV
jgi:hypothetical protein